MRGRRGGPWRGPGAAFIFLLVLHVLTSCRTVTSDPAAFDKAPLFGMLYDYDNQPLAGVQVIVDGDTGPQSDIHGRFVIADLSRGAHRLQFNREGFETLDLPVDFLNRTQVLYVRMISLDQLLTLAEERLDYSDWPGAREMLERAEKLNSGNPVLGYLKAVVAFKQGAYAEAAALLEDLLKRGYREAHILLFLADLHQARLGSSGQAGRYLREYLEMRADPDAERRLRELTGEGEAEWEGEEAREGEATREEAAVGAVTRTGVAAGAEAGGPKP